MTERTDNAGRRHIALTTAVLLATGVAFAYAGGGAGRIAAPPVSAVETERPVEAEQAVPVSTAETAAAEPERPAVVPAPAVERDRRPAEPGDTRGSETVEEPSHETVPPSIRDEDRASEDDSAEEPDEERGRSDDEERRGPLGNKPSERPQTPAR